MKDTVNYDQGYKDGFQQGFLTAIIIGKAINEKKSFKSEDFQRQKKAAKDWAVSMGYLKTKKTKKT